MEQLNVARMVEYANESVHAALVQAMNIEEEYLYDILKCGPRPTVQDVAGGLLRVRMTLSRCGNTASDDEPEDVGPTGPVHFQEPVNYAAMIMPRTGVLILGVEHRRRDHLVALRARINRRVVYAYIFIEPATIYMMTGLMNGLSILPPLPKEHCNHLYFRDNLNDDGIEWSRYSEPLPELTTDMAPSLRVEMGELEMHYNSSLPQGLNEVTYDNKPMVVKTMSFPKHCEALNRELWAYTKIACHADWKESHVTPRLRALVTEGEEPVGFMMDQIVDFEYPSLSSVHDCRALVERLHKAGICHNNLQRRHFLIDPIRDGKMFLVGLGSATEFTPERAYRDIECLSDILL